MTEMSGSRYDRLTILAVWAVRILFVIAAVLGIIFGSTGHYYLLILQLGIMMCAVLIGLKLRKFPKQQQSICEFVKDFEDSRGMKAGRIYSDEDQLKAPKDLPPG